MVTCYGSPRKRIQRFREQNQSQLGESKRVNSVITRNVQECEGLSYEITGL